MRHFDASRPEFFPYGLACELWAPARMPRPDRHNEIEMNWLRDGAITYLLGGRRTTIEAGQLGIFWAAIPHQIVDFVGDAPYFVLTFPLSEFLRAGIDRKLVHRVLSGELLVDLADDPSEDVAFNRWIEDLETGEPQLVRAAQLEIRARLLRLSQRISDGPAQSSPLMLSRADQLACYIARNYQQRLTAQSIADAHELHPNYAMNLFRSSFGTTMSAFIVQHRISHAQRLLVTTDDAILNIGLESGFQSLSRFNEAFKEVCGCSPREYRKAHRTLHLV